MRVKNSALPRRYILKKRGVCTRLLFDERGKDGIFICIQQGRKLCIFYLACSCRSFFAQKKTEGETSVFVY